MTIMNQVPIITIDGSAGSGKEAIAKLVATDYFDLYGSWEGEAIQRPEQGVVETRDLLL